MIRRSKSILMNPSMRLDPLLANNGPELSGTFERIGSVRELLYFGHQISSIESFGYARLGLQLTAYSFLMLLFCMRVIQ